MSLNTVQCSWLSPFPDKDNSSDSVPAFLRKGICRTLANSVFLPHSGPFPIVAPFTLDHVQEVRTCRGPPRLLTKVVGVGGGEEDKSKDSLSLSPTPAILTL